MLKSLGFLRRHVTSAVAQHRTHATCIRIFNNRRKEMVPLDMLTKPFLTFYTCGPTVYDSAHIGHASCYVRLDIIQRILRTHFHLPIVTAMNITDIDDKIIARSQETGTSWSDLARHCETEFWSDLRRLNVRQPDIKLRVTEHIPEIVRFIQTLIDKGYGYGTPDGSVYFDTLKYEAYGKLQNVTADETAGTGKKHAVDFALWKAAKQGEPYWETSFGRGRPGWHIECSTLASGIFGNHIDIHAGGLDLRFPHHENEEAQSCCYHDVQDWVTHWVHTGQLHLEGQTHKMSKSLKNTINIGELLQHFTADEFRMLCLLSHYRSVIEYGEETMALSKSMLKKFSSFFDDARSYVAGIKPSANLDAVALNEKQMETQQKLQQFLQNDFNTNSAIIALGDLVSSVNKAISHPSYDVTIGASNVCAVQAISSYVKDQLVKFGLSGFQTQSTQSQHDLPSEEYAIDAIVAMRGKIRLEAMQSKDKQLFMLCDRIRNTLKTVNIEIKDHGKSSSWSYVKR